MMNATLVMYFAVDLYTIIRNNLDEYPKGPENKIDTKMKYGVPFGVTLYFTAAAVKIINVDTAIL